MAINLTNWTAGQLLAAYIPIALAAYFCGCFNGAILISKHLLHDDVRTHGSGNAGLTNFYRNYGAKYAGLVIVLDMLKAVAAVLLSAAWLRLLGHQGMYLCAAYPAGLFCVIGHMYPFMFRFKGGKGILCSGMLLLLLDWRIALVSWGLFILLWLTTRYVSLGSAAAAIAFPVTTYFCYGDAMLTCFALLTALLVLFAHRDNISRLLRGEERKFHFHINPIKEDEQ